jgi:hypothetical protein
MDSILISTAHAHPEHAEGEEDRYKYISHHTHRDERRIIITQNKSSSEIAFVVLQLHCKLKVVLEGTSLILSKSGIEHAEETFQRARVGGVCQQRSQHKRKVRKRSRVAPPPLRQGKCVFPLYIFSLV